MVKRYELVEGDCVEDTGLVEDDFGYWVEYPDYAALESRLAELEKDAARYRWLRDFGRSEGFSVEEDSGAWINTHSSSSLDEALDRKLSLALAVNE